MTGLVLIHWKAEEIPERLERLRSAGHSAESWDPRLPGAMARFRGQPPSAIIIDLTRLPSHGRACASALRQQKAYRHVPLIFAGGTPAKVEEIRKVLPDATYSGWEELDGAIRRVMIRPVTEPVVPPDLVSRPQATLVRKLLIERGSTVSLLKAPEGFEGQLEPLPANVRIRTTARARSDVVLLFVRTESELNEGLGTIESALDGGSRVWIVWPKRTSGCQSDLNPTRIRELLAHHGLVDYKVCSIDATWSGMLFARSRRNTK